MIQCHVLHVQLEKKDAEGSNTQDMMTVVLSLPQSLLRVASDTGAQQLLAQQLLWQLRIVGQPPPAGMLCPPQCPELSASSSVLMPATTTILRTRNPKYQEWQQIPRYCFGKDQQDAASSLCSLADS